MANYNLTTALASQYQKDLQTVNQDAFGRSEWDRFFLNPLKQQYTTAVEEVTSNVNYDVSQAYNRYKQQQLALLQNQNIATGLQEQLTEQAASAYQSQYAQAKEEGEGLMYNLQQQYATKLAEAGEQLAEKADLYAALEQAAYEYGGVNMEDYYDMVLSQEAPYERTYTLKPEGEDYLKRAFFTDLQEGMSFEQYLESKVEEDEKYQSMLDLYRSDPATARELIGGISRDKWRYDREDVEQLKQAKLDKIESGKSSLGNYDSYVNNIVSDLVYDTNTPVARRQRVLDKLSQYINELGVSEEWTFTKLRELIESEGLSMSKYIGNYSGAKEAINNILRIISGKQNYEPKKSDSTSDKSTSEKAKSGVTFDLYEYGGGNRVL